MNYEHYYEHFMNTFMNTFLRVMNTMNTLRVNSYLLSKKCNSNLLVILFNLIINNIKCTCVCICSQSVHCVHQQIQSIHKSIHHLFILVFIFGGVD